MDIGTELQKYMPHKLCYRRREKNRAPRTGGYSPVHRQGRDTALQELYLSSL